MHVPSKAFGEFVEHAYGTPSVSAEELKAIMDSGRKLVVLDSRPMDEYRVMNIQTGVDVPGAELVLRVGEVAPDPDRSEEHTSELQSLMRITYAVFCMQKKKQE